MFTWYTRASICYVHFSDIPTSSVPWSSIRSSRWFTRGWTLQELIAPRQMAFFASDWTEIASKLDILPLLSEITKIDESVLMTGDLSEASVAKKMSWAASRKTSRGEDAAYCLLGIFDVNMPLLYGEGAVKAFRRLQEAIMRTTHDQSLFAWGTFVDKFSITPPPATNLPWQRSDPQYGLFAESPADFSESGDIVPVDHGYAHIIDRERPPTVLHGGALVNLVVYKTRPCVRYWDTPQFAWQDEVEIVVLMVHPNSDSDIRLIAIALNAWGDGYHSRTRELCAIKLFVSQYRFQAMTKQRHILPPRPFNLEHRDIFFQLEDVDYESSGFERPMLPSGPAWRMKWRDRVLRLSKNAQGNEEARYRFKIEEGRYISVGFSRVAAHPEHGALLGYLQVDVINHKVTPDDNGTHRGLSKPLGGKTFRHVMKLPEDAWRVAPEKGMHLEVSSRRVMLSDKGEGIDLVGFSLKRVVMTPTSRQVSWRD
jgi:hypothetical protein